MSFIISTCLFYLRICVWLILSVRTLPFVLVVIIFLWFWKFCVRYIQLCLCFLLNLHFWCPIGCTSSICSIWSACSICSISSNYCIRSNLFCVFLSLSLLHSATCSTYSIRFPNSTWSEHVLAVPVPYVVFLLRLTFF